ncbi:NAD(P)H azoreductase-like [Dysidea avara]|uniref:NAD(P)H azoreductase-like n=1 Tax=Dysidea avara TaxID=196820 RepID=UPI0033311D45
MAKPVVFVIGASGNIGFSTTQALSTKYADKLEIRAGVRDPDKADKLKALPGVTVVKATQGDKEQLVKTFAGVSALYIVAPGTENRAELAIKTAEAAKEAGVKHLLVLSVPTYEVTSTVFGKQFTEIETAVSKLGVPYTFIRLPLFVENYFGFKETIQKMSTIILPVDPTKPYTPVVVADAGKAGAAILADPSKHVNKGYCVVSNRHTHGDVAKVFSEVLGKEVTITTNKYEEAKQLLMSIGIPEWQADGGMELYKLIDSGSTATNQQNLSSFKDITGEEPTSLKDWVTGVAPAFK